MVDHPMGCQVKNFKFFQISAMVLINWDEEILKIWWPYLFSLQNYSDFIVKLVSWGSKIEEISNFEWVSLQNR